MNLKRMVLCAVFLSAALSAAEPFSFVRPVKVSDSFLCSVFIRQSSRYSFFIPGADQPVVKLSSVQADFYGYLTVRQVNSAGNPERLSIRADRFSGSINGIPVKTDLPAGTWIEADLSQGKAVFSIGGKRLFGPHDLPDHFGDIACGLDRRTGRSQGESDFEPAVVIGQTDGFDQDAEFPAGEFSDPVRPVVSDAAAERCGCKLDPALSEHFQESSQIGLPSLASLTPVMSTIQ